MGKGESSGGREVVVVGQARTPMGALLGELAPLSAPQLGAVAIAGGLARAGLAADQIHEVIMGCVLSAGLGQAPARQAALGAGLPQGVACTTVNKVCGSGMKALMMAMDAIALDPGLCIAAGGMESMSNAPHLLPRLRAGQRLGHTQVVDHMFFDGLEDAYETGCLMGHFAEDTARERQITRADQDAFALASLQRALEASREGRFRPEITDLGVVNPGAPPIQDDEPPRRARPEKIPTLKPAFHPDGTITAANASSIADGAAALVLTSAELARDFGCRPLARLVGYSGHAQAPSQFTTAPIPAIEKLLAKVGWGSADVDLWELNEAFAVVTLAAMDGLKLPHERVNVFGGACALGHPIGASGARVVVTLIKAHQQMDKGRGVAAVCIGGGEDPAIALAGL